MNASDERAATDPFARRGWWTDREFASLRAVTDVRHRVLRRWVPELGAATVVDLGCGGGLLTARMATPGARAIGVDRALPALGEARERVRGARFVAGDLFAVPLADGCADLVLLADVLEHVDDPAGVVREGARLLRPGGYLFVNTINRTLRARVLAVTIAERLGLIPRGTHDPRLFVRPHELRDYAAACGLRLCRETGERPRLLATLRSWTVQVEEAADMSVGYAQLFAKEAAS